MKEKYSKKNRTIYILILLIILLLASTYAWFTINKNVRVETLNVQVASAGNLEISVDAINWKDAINSEELLDGIHTNYPRAVNQIPENGLYPTSTAGNVNNGKMEMFYGEVRNDKGNNTYSLTAKKEIENHGKDGNFIAFDIFLKVDEDTTLYLNSETNIQSESVINTNRQTGIENAVRIAILDYGRGNNSSTAQNLIETSKPIIIEPNYDIHTTSGIQSAKNIYGIGNLQLTGNRALTYYGIKKEITTARPLNDKSNTYFSIVDPAIKLENRFFNGQDRVELLNLSKGITKLRVYLWIEGQDVDCEDNASGANLKFDLQFTT